MARMMHDGPAIGAACGALLYAGSRPLHSPHGDFMLHCFQNLATRAAVLVAVAGSPAGGAPLLARVHSSCVTSEAYGSCDCDCATQLDAAFARVAAAGRGMIVYLMQEGRGAGFASKVRDRMLVQASGGRLTTFDAYAQMGLGDDHRTYDEVVLARRLLGVEAPFVLLTNNPEKRRALEAAGVPIASTSPLRSDASPFAAQYLRAKRRAGHRLGRVDGDACASALPEPVEAFEPVPVPEIAGVVHLASYLLPLGTGAGDPVWLRLHAYFDLAAACERVILTYGTPGADVPLVRVQRERLVARLPGRSSHRARWQATVQRFVRHGAGVAAVLPDDAWTSLTDDGGSAPALPASVAALVARHLGGRRARLLLARDEAAADAGLCRTLKSAGVDTVPSAWLEVAGTPG
jgi:GTP cyclohydrolase II